MAEEQTIIDPVVLDAISDLERRRLSATAAAGSAVPVDPPAAGGNGGGLILRGGNGSVNCASVRHLCEYLDRDGQVTELIFKYILIPSPTDGGLEMLRTFFTTNKTLLDVTLVECDFGTEQETVRLLSAFQTSRNVTNVTIHMYLDDEGIHSVVGAPLGICYSGILQHNTRLRKFDCGSCHLGVDGMGTMQPGLRANNTLTKLLLSGCKLLDAGIGLLADSFASNNNSALEMLNISANGFGPDGLSHVTRIIEETKLREIDFGFNRDVFANENMTRGFTSALSRSESLKTIHACEMVINPMIFMALEGDTIALERLYLGYFPFLPGQDQQRQAGIDQLMRSLPLMKNLRQLGIHFDHLKLCVQDDSFLPALDCNLVIEHLSEFDELDIGPADVLYNKIVAARCILKRNWALNRAKSLLDLQSPTNMPIRSKSGIWPNALGGLGAIRILTPSIGTFDIDTQNMSYHRHHHHHHPSLQMLNNILPSNWETVMSTPRVYTHPGISSIFLIFQSRPFIFDPLPGAIIPFKAKDVKVEPQIVRSGATTVQPDSHDPLDDDDRKPAAVQEGCKRRRL